MNDSDPVPRWFLGILSFLSVGSVLGAVGLVVHEWRLTWSGRCAKGTVVGLEEQRAGDDEVAWYPQVEFRIDDRAVKFRGPVGSAPAAYRIGDRVRVLYPPDDPEHATIDTFSNRWLLPIILALAAAVFGGFVWLLR